MDTIERAALLCLLALLSACTSTPLIEVDTQKMTSIKTIAVAVPKPTRYSAVTAGGPIFVPIPGAGVLAAAIGGAIAGGTAAASNRTNNDFDGLVRDRLGDTGLNRRYVDSLEKELRDQGYQVKEINLDQDDMPKISGDRFQPVLKGQAFTAADAIMIAPVNTGYGANGVGCPYVRAINSQIRIFASDTFKPIFSQNFFYNARCHVNPIGNRDDGVNMTSRSGRDDKRPDPYSYQFYSDLINDLPHAIQGLDETLLSFVPQFHSALLAGRGVAQSLGDGQK
ncbi:hypothetical protein PQQ73_00610 [Paraburkholderia strydomiana]|uniref:Lipoprotein n=1 Tax=Paraburkholderia strydomiana TaxID=1245417 RepID=A0ABW9E5U6_9BURK